MVGSYNLMQFLDGLEAFTLRVFVNVLQWSAEEVKINIAEVRKDVLNMKLQIQGD
jgi:hypothetical protein